MSLPSRSSGGLQGLSWAGPYQSLCPYLPLCPEKTFFAVAKWITSGSQMHYAPSVIWLLLYILLSALDPCLIPPYTSSKQDLFWGASPSRKSGRTRAEGSQNTPFLWSQSTLSQYLSWCIHCRLEDCKLFEDRR